MLLKKIFVILVMTITSSYCFSQEEVGSFTIQPKAGICVPLNDTSADPDNSEFHNQVCFTGGFELEYQLSKKFSASIAAMYSHQFVDLCEEFYYSTLNIENYIGTWQLVDYSNSDGNYDFELLELQTKKDFLNIPVLINFYPIKGLAVKAGIQTNIVLGHHYEIHHVYGQWFNSEWETYSGVDYNSTNKLSLSLPVGFSYEFKHFVLDTRYNIGLTKVQSNPFSETSYCGSCFYITFGYKIPQ